MSTLRMQIPKILEPKKLPQMRDVFILPRIKPDEWKCPKCGATGIDIQCSKFTLSREDEHGFHKIIPLKIWCMRCGKEYPAYNRFVMSFPRLTRTKPTYEVKCEECGHRFTIDNPIGWWSSKSRRMYNPKEEILHTIGYCSRCKSDQFLLLLHRVETFVLS